MMAGFRASQSIFIVVLAIVCLLPGAHAFGAGNIPGISTVEGHNWRHGDIEDMLKTVACIKGHKWTSMMIKRVYFGNWLRDYSQAVDVGSLKGVSAPTIRILVWVLSFLSFGYATREFEVTDERLGVYRPEEHIDNPKDYADNLDARQYDPRLRGPIQPAELQVDPNTGMKNYIANERGGWATSSGYIKYSLSKSIHHGRLYTHGTGAAKGREEDLCEALRCMGQALHCLEDFGAHTNYVELALIELGFHHVFPHVGTHTQLNVQGKTIYPLTTGTFGAVDFLHSVLGEATDHLAQSEIDEMDIALMNAESSSKPSSSGTRGFFGSGGSSGGASSEFLSLLGQIPGAGSGLSSQARDLQASSEAQEYENQRARANPPMHFQGPPGSVGGPPGPGVPGMKPDFDPIKTAKQIYPILEFRDNVVRAISATIAKIPGLEKLVEAISEKITVFIMSLLAPFVRPIIEAVSKSLKDGSSTVVKSSEDQQFLPWNDPRSSDPTHSMLSKDHFSNYLNPVAGRVAATILQYTVPRVLFAWETPGVPVSEVVEDVLRAFHHPALRQDSCEIHRNMFSTVKKWVDENPKRNELNHVLGSTSVKAGHNHKGENIHDGKSHSHGASGHDSHGSGLGGYGQAASQIWGKIQARDLGSMYDGQGTSRGVSPEPAAFSHSTYGYSGMSQGGGGQFLDTSRPGSGYGGYDAAAPTTHDPYGSGHQSHQQHQQPYQAQEFYAQPQRPASGSGYSNRPMPGGWDDQPQQQSGWSQGPSAPSPGYGGQPPFGGPPQQGGWSEGPPQQEGWSQGLPPSQSSWSGGDQQQGGWSHGHGNQHGGGYGGY